MHVHWGTEIKIVDSLFLSSALCWLSEWVYALIRSFARAHSMTRYAPSYLLSSLYFFSIVLILYSSSILFNIRFVQFRFHSNVGFVRPLCKCMTVCIWARLSLYITGMCMCVCVCLLFLCVCIFIISHFSFHHFNQNSFVPFVKELSLYFQKKRRRMKYMFPLNKLVECEHRYTHICIRTSYIIYRYLLHSFT